MTTLLEFFDATYLVNLPERVDRLKSAKQQLAQLGWTLGLTGVQIFPARSFEDEGEFPGRGARGCFYSHLECLQLAHLENCDNVLMLEDDIAISSSIVRLAPLVCSQLSKSSWDFVYFGHELTGEIPRATWNTEAVKLIPWTRDVQTTHFYGVNRRIMPRLIAHLERLARGTAGSPEGGPMHLDGAYADFRQRNPDVQCVIAWPKLGWQRPSRSDIAPRAFDHLTYLRPLTTVLRDLKHMATRWRS